MTHDPNRPDTESRSERATSASTGLLFIALLVAGVLASVAPLEQPAAAEVHPGTAVMASETSVPNPAPASESQDVGCGCAEACLVQNP